MVAANLEAYFSLVYVIDVRKHKYVVHIYTYIYIISFRKMAWIQI